MSGMGVGMTDEQPLSRRRAFVSCPATTCASLDTRDAGDVICVKRL
jgi:hypothetical protein